MRTIFALLFISNFFSCSAAKNQIDYQGLDSKTFSVHELNGKDISSEGITLNFNSEEGRVYGSSGCNNYNGSFSFEGNKISFGPIASTKRMCLVMASENELFELLGKTLTFSIENGSLELKLDNETMLKASESRKKTYQDKTITYEYKAVSRGFFLFINLSNDGHYLTVSTHPDMKPARQSYTDEDWNKLMNELDKLNLKSIPNIEVPSKDHQFDGAPVANLKITVDSKEYQTVSFDHGNPPQEISEIVKILLSFAEKE